MVYYTYIVSFIFTFSLLMPLIPGDNQNSSAQVISPHCSSTCGNTIIPYPFGIEEGCYYDEKIIEGENSSFKITCNYSASPPTPILGVNIEVLNISIVEGELRSRLFVSYDCYNQTGYVDSFWNSLNLISFTVSSTKNILVAIGCDTYAWFSGVRHNKPYETGCLTSCADPNDVIDGECTGVGCCEVSNPGGITNVSINVNSFHNHSSVYSFNPCSAAFAVEKDAFRFHRSNLSEDLGYYYALMLPVVFNWVIAPNSCSDAKLEGRYLCGNNTDCSDPDYEVGHRCKCKDGFSGNPYLPQGCQDINECNVENNCTKPARCFNTFGSYYCKCPKGYHGNGTTNNPCVSNIKPWFMPVMATAGIGGGIILLLVIAFILHLRHGKRQIKKMREKCFQQNGGFLLHQKLSGRDVEVLKIFTAQDLEIATNKFSDKYIIGRGGFGIVYKGVLPNNQQIAIKRSLKVDPNQVEQFINEILILSQINNRNVVKLLGCCLETEVPLLVYEFITNGTLYEHLDDVMKASRLLWPMRLTIASEVANVLSYLHNTISTQIIHRDMKSMNILLDENYTAKVADFGASRLVPEDQGQLGTMVMGTLGYLDPEYMQTSELTEKSDVYSFGVVLVELLTRKKAISNDRPETERCLAMHFLVNMKEGSLLNILDKSIVNEGTINQIQEVANLAKGCLMLKGDDRPTMKEVAIELEMIKRKGSHSWIQNNETFPGDNEPLIGRFPRSDTGGSSSGIDSDLYTSPQMLTTLGGGR